MMANRSPVPNRTRPRLLEVGEFAEAAELVDRSMRPGAAFSMAEDFPLLVGRASDARRWVLCQDDRLVAHTAARQLRVRVPDGKEPISLVNIGAVCTDPDYRGLGLARKLVQHAMDDAALEGAEVAILWTDIPKFYHPLGYVELGSETQFAISVENLSGVPAVEVWAPAPDEAAAVCRMNDSEPYHLERSPMARQILFGLPLSETYVALHNGEPVAYVVYGKGLDFQGVICEWGGPVEILPALLLQVMLAENTADLLIIGPTHHSEFTAMFEAMSCPKGVVPLAMMAPCHEGKLRQRVGRYLGTAAVENLNGQELLQLLFGPAAAAPTAGGKIPWPFYVWGLDSM